MTRTSLLKLANLLAAIQIILSNTIAEEIIGHSMTLKQRCIKNLALLFLLVFILWSGRALYATIRAFNKGDYSRTIVLGDAFLTDMKAHPWKRWLFVFRLPVYTTNPKTAALCITGQACTLLGDPQSGMERLFLAARLDPSCPTVHVALGIAYAAMGDAGMVARSFERARELGYTGSVVDRIFGGGELFTAVAATAVSRRPPTDG